MLFCCDSGLILKPVGVPKICVCISENEFLFQKFMCVVLCFESLPNFTHSQSYVYKRPLPLNESQNHFGSGSGLVFVMPKGCINLV